MTWILMFFVCGHSNGGSVYCEWKHALVFNNREDCAQILNWGHAGGHTIKLGDGYLLARCAPQAKVEK